jgi:hypothetical protein
MSASIDLQWAIEELLAAPGALRVAVPVVRRRTKEIAAEIEAAAANAGLCIQVMPPLPVRVTEGAACVFVEAAEIRVRIVEQPAMNATGADAYDLVDDVMRGCTGGIFPRSWRIRCSLRHDRRSWWKIRGCGSSM